VHRVLLRVAEQFGIAVTSVELVLLVDVRGVERQAHLFHPILGGDSKLYPLVLGRPDDRVGQAFGTGVDVEVRRLLLQETEDFPPEGFLLAVLQAGLVVHPELESVDIRYDPDELGHGRLRVRGEVLLRHTPDEARRRPGRGHPRPRYAPGLNAAAVDVVPQAEGDPQPPSVSHPDQPIDRVQVAFLLLGGQIDHPDVGEPVDVKKVGVRRGEEAAVLVAEDHDQRVEAVLR